MQKNVRYIHRVFITEKRAKFVTPGHEEIELALLKLYEYTGEEESLELARFFLNQRGANAIDDASAQIQADRPVREIREAVGHAVRACYLYAAMAKMAGIDGDSALKEACDRVFEDIVGRKMSVTGGIGSTKGNEAFSYAYDLPNTSIYNETCAAIALALFAGELQQLTPSSLYGDIIERIYYNGFLSGLSLSGDRFFYANPLEIDQKKYNRFGEYQPESERVKVFECSCCPPNVVRMLSSLPRFAYTTNGDTVYCNQFFSGTTKLKLPGGEAVLTQRTNYPVSGKITFHYQGPPAVLRVRIPHWCVEYTGKTQNGFTEFPLSDENTFSLDLPIKVHFIEADPRVQDNSGRYAVMRGPLVYCMESVDNGENLRDITLLESGTTEVRKEEDIPAPVIYMDAERRFPQTELYQLKSDRRQPFIARLIPYFSFGNRGPSDMLMWTMIR